MQPQHPNFKYTGREPDMSKQPARSYIKECFKRKYRNKLLKALDSYLRRESINFSEYKVTDLANDVNLISNQRGIGAVTAQTLQQQLKEDGWL